MQRGWECVTSVSLIRPKFKAGNHLIMARGRLVSSPTTSHYVTLRTSLHANVNVHWTWEKLSVHDQGANNSNHTAVQIPFTTLGVKHYLVCAAFHHTLNCK